MENKKTLGVYPIIHNNRIQSLRSFLNTTRQMYDYQKINLSNSDFTNYLKITCYHINEKIFSTIQYYQYNRASIINIEKAKEKCKDLSILLNKYKTELIKLDINPDEYLSFKKEIDDAFDFELTENLEGLLPNYLEIQKEFLDYINIRSSTNETIVKQTVNLFTTIFKGDTNLAFLLFQKFIENDIADPYTDYSFIFQQMKKDNLITDVKHKTFYSWLFEQKYITESDFDKFEINRNLKSLQKSHSEKRLNKYLRLKEAYSL